MKKPILKIKRAYEKPSAEDGYRILVDRLWPRGIKKTEASINEWAKDIAPTTDLRKWYAHELEKWADFQKRYVSELKKNDALPEFIESIEDKKLITLVYATRDEEHTHALVLQNYLTEHFKH